VQIAADAADRIEGSFLVRGELILGGASRSSLLAIWETSLSMLSSAAGAGHSTTGARFGAWASAVKPRVKARPHRPAATSFSPFIVRPRAASPVRRKFKDRVTREVHFFLAEMTQAVPARRAPGDPNMLIQLPGENKFRVLLATSLRSGKLTEPESQKLMKESWT